MFVDIAKVMLISYKVWK